MNNPEKGHLIEMYVKTKLTELGYDIFTPLFPGSIVDLILKKGSRLYKVQIKSLSKNDDSSYVIHTKQTRLIKGKYLQVTYPRSEIDFFIGYNTDDKVFVALDNSVEVENSLSKTFRKEYPVSGQKKNINLIKDFSLELFLSNLGNTYNEKTISYEDRLEITKEKAELRQVNRTNLTKLANDDKLKKKALSRVGSSGYIGVGLRKTYSDGTEIFQAVIRPKKGDKQVTILMQSDPKACAEAYDKYITDNNLDKPTNKQIGLL